MVAAQDVGALRHEVHAAENDVLSLLTAGGLLREFERVAAIVCELDDLIALVVVPQDHESRPQRRLGAPNALIKLLLGELDVGFGQRIKNSCRHIVL